MIGTQMLAKGHDFQKLALVLILQADAGLFSTDFRSPERTAQLLIQVAGRAGRGEARGNVLIQTHFPDHPLLNAISRHDYNDVFDAEISLRKAAELPPISHLAIIRADSSDLEQLETGLMRIREYLAHHLHQSNTQTVRLLGPFPAVMARRKNRYQALLWCCSSNKPQLLSALRHLAAQSPKTLSLPSNFHWIIDVDPYETL